MYLFAGEWVTICIFSYFQSCWPYAGLRTSSNLEVPWSLGLCGPGYNVVGFSPDTAPAQTTPGISCLTLLVDSPEWVSLSHMFHDLSLSRLLPQRAGSEVCKVGASDHASGSPANGAHPRLWHGGRLSLAVVLLGAVILAGVSTGLWMLRRKPSGTSGGPATIDERSAQVTGVAPAPKDKPVPLSLIHI